MCQERLAGKTEGKGEKPMTTEEISALLAQAEGGSRLRILYNGNFQSYAEVLFKIPSNGCCPIAVRLDGDEMLQRFEDGWLYSAITENRPKRFAVQGISISQPPFRSFGKRTLVGAKS